MRRSSRLSEGKAELAPAEPEVSAPPKNKRQRRTPALPPSSATAAASATKVEEGVEGGGDDGPSAYELQRLARIKENARMMAALGLGGAKGDMRTAVQNDAAQRAKARGLGPRSKPKGYPARTR